VNFRDISKRATEIFTFKTGILWVPVIEETTKVKLHEGNQLDFPHAALSCKYKGCDYWVLCSW